jgi:hypothetical protein
MHGRGRLHCFVVEHRCLDHLDFCSQKPTSASCVDTRLSGDLDDRSVDRGVKFYEKRSWSH